MTLDASITHNNKNPCTKFDHSSFNKILALVLTCNNEYINGKMIGQIKGAHISQAWQVHKNEIKWTAQRIRRGSSFPSSFISIA